MLKTLIIDDDKINGNLIKKILEKNGHEAHWIESAKNSLEFIKEHKIELVLLDIVMPEMSGTEALKMIRVEYDHIALPVIMVTSSNEDENIVDALKLGANDYITKPVNFPVLLARISTQTTVQKLSQQLGNAKKIETQNAMIITYNHHINNPLSIIIGHLSMELHRNNELDNRLKDIIDNSLTAANKIKDIVKGIEDISKNNSSKIETYAGTEKMFKV